MGRRLKYLLVVVCCIVAAEAYNFTLSAKKDTRRVIDIGVFGYGGGEGKLELTVKNFFLDELDEYRSADEKLGFTLDLVSSAAYARRERSYSLNEANKEVKEDSLGNTCFIEDRNLIPKNRYVIPLQDRLHDADEALTKSGGKDAEAFLKRELHEMHVVITVPTPGLYALFFYNCKKFNNNKDPVHATFDLEISQYNIMADSGEISFLSVGDSFLPMMYFVFFLFFLMGLILWHREICNPEAKRRGHIRAIHYVMYLLVFLKTCSVLLDCAMLWQRKRDGHLKGAVDYIFYIFQTLRGITLFVVVALLGTGWSFLKPFLSERDKKLLILILPLQVIINIAMAVIDETSEGSNSWGQWQGTLRLLDIVCCCAIFLPVVWSIKTLQDAAGTDGKASRNLSRLRHFRTFYLVLVIFIYFTRVGIPFIEGMVVYQHSWVPRFLYEAAALSFYCYTGSMFQPSARPDEANATAEMEGDDVEEIEITVSTREEVKE